MLIKQFTEMRDPKTWDLAKDEDIIITRKGTAEQRVLINYKTYESIKKMLFRLQRQLELTFEDDDIDWLPYIQDFKDVLETSNFKEIEPDYFENLARKIKTDA